MHLQGMGCPAVMHVLFDCGFRVLMHLQGMGCLALMYVLFDCGFRVLMHLQGMGCLALMYVLFDCGFRESGVGGREGMGGGRGGGGGLNDNLVIHSYRCTDYPSVDPQITVLMALSSHAFHFGPACKSFVRQNHLPLPELLSQGRLHIIYTRCLAAQVILIQSNCSIYIIVATGTARV